ncbi:glycosyltransferase [Prosthecobacter sp.]|uniref:glycosyltransferase n=1 Tax=Prosthecobacter sp. TaxID=1965333 RepID=UPI002AB8D1C2|nr:glycosyltransferase [Prosthecobacter sp.]MDZ4401079.1 glycosyltransferase [Prosthecobacter sp.]
MALPAMARALAARGIRVDVATTDDDGPGRRLKEVPHGVPVDQEGFRVFYFPKQTEFYKVSIPLLIWLRRHVADYDVVHVHAVFSFSTLAAGWACRLRGVPFIVRPLGVLNTWGMNNRRRWIKTLSFRLLDKPVLDHASAIHYTSRQEADEAARLGIRARAAVIPLGMDLGPFSSLPSPELFTARFPATAGRPIILFLSRLDPKKNVELLLEAMARLGPQSDPIRPNPTESDPILVIAGSGAPAYVAELKARAHDLGLEKQVVWAGHLEGDMKLSALAAATVYVLPSHSENFGIALLEAMAAGLACVSTAGVALAVEAANEEAVLLSGGDPQKLAEILRRLLSNPSERHVLGVAAAQLALTTYSSDAAAESLGTLYGSIIQIKKS